MQMILSAVEACHIQYITRFKREPDKPVQAEYILEHIQGCLKLSCDTLLVLLHVLHETILKYHAIFYHKNHTMSWCIIFEIYFILVQQLLHARLLQLNEQSHIVILFKIIIAVILQIEYQDSAISDTLECDPLARKNYMSPAQMLRW